MPPASTHLQSDHRSSGGIWHLNACRKWNGGARPCETLWLMGTWGLTPVSETFVETANGKVKGVWHHSVVPGVYDRLRPCCSVQINYHVITQSTPNSKNSTSNTAFTTLYCYYFFICYLLSVIIEHALTVTVKSHFITFMGVVNRYCFRIRWRLYDYTTVY